MSGYDRKVQYLDYCERGERRFGAGFAMLERRGGLCCVSVQISGLKRRDCFSGPLLALTEEGERELARLRFTDGCARLRMERLPAQSLDGRGLRYDALLGLRVPLTGESEICSIWGSTSAEPVPRDASDDLREPAPIVQDESIASEEPAESPTEPSQDQQEPAVPVQADKWQQILSIYPQVHPFEDERVYLQIGLGDFVLLSAQSYPLVNNSFLLHGFYSYRHLVLARMQDRGGVRFYVGVPGSFYERERRIAVMFGFESFECAREPAREGDFGYYMVPVSL